jgi:transaldolase
VQDGEIHDYRCLICHRYSTLSLLEAHSEAQEKALWAAIVRAVESEFSPATRQGLQFQAEKKMQQAARLREIIEQLKPFETA